MIIGDWLALKILFTLAVADLGGSSLLGIELSEEEFAEGAPSGLHPGGRRWLPERWLRFPN